MEGSIEAPFVQNPHFSDEPEQFRGDHLPHDIVCPCCLEVPTQYSPRSVAPSNPELDTPTHTVPITHGPPLDQYQDGLGPPAAATYTTQTTRDKATRKGYKYECEICYKMFDRLSRSENCRNRHENRKPHRCLGRCGISGWYAFFSKCHFTLITRISDAINLPVGQGMGRLNIWEDTLIQRPSVQRGELVFFFPFP